ncbi:hypothetical protein [Streptomyces sp. NPDC001833]
MASEDVNGGEVPWKRLELNARVVGRDSCRQRPGVEKGARNCLI